MVMGRHDAAGGRPRRRILLWVGMAVAVLAAPAALFAMPASAGTGNGYGYVWASSASPTIGSAYTPVLNYQYNSAGATNTVTRLATGSYAVRFPSLKPGGGTALVSAYGGTTNRCKLLRWSGTNTGTTVYVNCYTRTGSPTDSLFTASFTNPGGGVANAAYGWNDQPGAALGVPFTPSLTYQYNSQGRPNTITHNDTGVYIVRLPGLTMTKSTLEQLQVTAYGAPAGDPSAYCDVDASPGMNGGQLTFEVGCYTASNAPIDSSFTFTFIEHGNHLLAPLSSHPTAIAGIHCDPASEGGQCNVDTPFSYPSGTITVQTLSTGEYAVQLPMSLAGGNVQLTGYYLGNTTRGRCSIASWNSSFGIRVNCFDTNGAKTTDFSTFTLGFVS